MIRVAKGPVPEILRRNAKRWTVELLAAPENPATPAEKKLVERLLNRYRQDEVLAALTLELHGKCAYCESKIAHIAYAQIEHYRPKKPFRDLAFEWTNLTLGCPRCNGSKSNHWDPALPYVNPYRDDPAQFFLAGGPFLYARPGNKRAIYTIAKIRLNRPELIERRIERLKYVEQLLQRYAAETLPSIRDLIRYEILDSLAPDKEYSFCAKAFVDLNGLP